MVVLFQSPLLKRFVVGSLLALGLGLGCGFGMPRLYANDASFVGDGATVFATQETRIRMAKETILISPVDQETGRMWKAECTFEFENPTQETVQLLMGFPNWKGFGDGVESSKYVIEDFSTHVDGQFVAAELKPVGVKPSSTSPIGTTPELKSQTDKTSSYETFIRPPRGKIAKFEGAFVWSVEFAPGAKRTVKNVFRFGGFTSNGPFDALEHMPTTYPKISKSHRFWESRKPKKSDIDFANALVGAVAYITTTGLTWNGPIGEAEITFLLPEWMKRAPHYLIPLPTGYHFQRDRIVWKFRNYRPKSEIVLYYINHVFRETPGSEVPTPGPFGFEYPEQARAWMRFNKFSHVDPDVIEQAATLTPSPAVKALLKK